MISLAMRSFDLSLGPFSRWRELEGENVVVKIDRLERSERNPDDSSLTSAGQRSKKKGAKLERFAI